MKKEELTEIFRTLGADNPEGWAESEIEEGLPQLARFLFLKGCWDNIVTDNDTSWIDKMITENPEDSNAPYAGIAHALRRLLAVGADPKDISELVRGMQAWFLFDICYQLSDPAAVEGNDYTMWCLCETDEDGIPIGIIPGLHESVLQTDPTGREIRPRKEGVRHRDMSS